MSKKLFALEELQEEEAVVIAPENEVADGLASSAADIGELSDQINHAEDVAGTISEIGDSLGKMGSEATIPAPAMEALNIAISGLLGSCGMSDRKRAITMESFSKAATAMESMEAIKETAIRIWEAIKKAFNKMLEYVNRFSSWVVESISGNKAKANKVKKDVSDLKTKHGSSEVTNLDKELSEASKNSGLFKGNAFTASSKDPAYLKLANNPSPDFKYDVGVGKNPSPKLEHPRDEAGRFVIKNAKLAHYFRPIGYAKYPQRAGINAAIEMLREFHIFYWKISASMEQACLKFENTYSKNEVYGPFAGMSKRSNENSLKVLKPGFHDEVFALAKELMIDTLSPWITERSMGFNEASADFKSRADYGRKTASGFIELPFDKFLEVSFVETGALRVMLVDDFLGGNREDAIDILDRMSLQSIDDLANEIVRSKDGHSLSQLKYLLNRQIKAGNSAYLEYSNNLEKEANAIGQLNETFRNFTSMERAANYMYGFFINVQTLLTQYKQKMESNLLEWASHSCHITESISNAQNASRS